MPTLIYILTPNGLHPAPYTADSLRAAQQHEPHEGVYTITNTYHHTQVLKLDAHLDRLADSAQRANIPLQLDRVALRQALRQMIETANFGDVRFRVTVPQATPHELILTIEPFQPPAAALLEQGVRAITAPNHARVNAAAKTTSWMHERETLEKAMPTGIYDTFLLDQAGYVLEGLASNFYALLHGELRTAGAGVLAGIAQQIVFEIAPPLVSVRREAVHQRELAACAEAFLTSSSRGIIPVIEIDGQPIGNGTRGAVTAQLQAAYQAWVTAHLEEL
jgi:branched-chain amino acid aminotransferase